MSALFQIKNDKFNKRLLRNTFGIRSIKQRILRKYMKRLFIRSLEIAKVFS